MTRVLSGIKPTGEIQLGNYLGALRQWVAAQDDAPTPEDALYCVVDLHALTVPWDPAAFADLTRHTAMLLMAVGLDPQRCTLFVQSHVPEHTELTWLLNCVATFGELRRMTQFKDKAAKQGAEGQESVSVGLFDYPVLMAADVLIYDTTHVPVGDDQRQHLELTRDVAIRFNHHFGDTFVVPEAVVPTEGARIMDLQRPDAKMSKSDDSPQGTLGLLDPPAALAKRVKSAVTDSDGAVRFDPAAKPGVSNLLSILAGVTDRTIAAAEAEHAGAGYGALKTAVADAVVEFVTPIQARYAELAADPAEVDRILAAGAARVEVIARGVLARARTAVGLLPRARSTAGQ
ncbi:MAG: tryptophan--tRNA ligase [Acidimicrobiia bacterium]